MTRNEHNAERKVPGRVNARRDRGRRSQIFDQALCSMGRALATRASAQQMGLAIQHDASRRARKFCVRNS